VSVSLSAFGTFASGTTSAVPDWPTGSAGDAIVAMIGCKPFSSTPTTTDGTFAQQASNTSGSVANGNGTGSVRATAFVKRATDGTSGSATFSVTSGSPTMGRMARVTTTSGTYGAGSTVLTDTDETLLSVSASATPTAGSIADGDLLVICVVLKDDAITHTAQTLTITGCSHGGVTWETKHTTTSGNDGAMYIGQALVTSGSVSGAITYSATSNTAGGSAAAVSITRIRELTPVPTGLAASVISDSQIDVSWNAVTGATSYTLERSPDGSTWSTVYTGATASFSDTGLDGLFTYSYRVSATASTGTSAVSSSVSGTTTFALPLTETFSSGVWNTGRWTQNHTADATATVASGAGVLNKTSTPGYPRLYLSSGSQTDLGVLLTATLTDSASSGDIRITLRSSGTWQASTTQRAIDGYEAFVQAGSGNLIAIASLVSSVSTTLSSTTWPAAPALGTAFKLRFEVVGTTVRLRCWLASGSEPGTWTLTATDANLTAGIGPMLVRSGGTAGTASVDDITVYNPNVAATPLSPPFALSERRIRRNSLLRR
jgi:hypothetical protein